VWLGSAIFTPAPGSRKRFCAIPQRLSATTGYESAILDCESVVRHRELVAISSAVSRNSTAVGSDATVLRRRHAEFDGRDNLGP
jgi:hypothetical protein